MPTHFDPTLFATQNAARRILIIGGGLSGVMLATRLGRHYRRDESVDVCLIDRAPIHVWKPMLHTFAAGTAHAHDEGIPLIAQANRSHFTYLPGSMTALDPNQKTVTVVIDDLPGVEPLSHLVGFDVAVIAVGSVANDFGTPGVAEHCHFIDTLWRAEQLNAAVRSEVVQRVLDGGPLSVAIVGGGATGVEFAAALARLVDVGATLGAEDLPSRLKITLLDAGERILGAFPEEVSERVANKLRSLGVTIVNEAKVERADSEGFRLHGGEQIDAALKVWAAGVKAPPGLAALSGFDTTRGGQLIVNEALQTTASANIFAMGDCASFTAPSAKRPLPPTGQVARQQADCLAVSIPGLLSGKPPRPFQYREMGSLVSLSQFGAYGTLGNEGVVPAIAIRGWFAMLAHAVFYRMHQFGLYGPLRGTIVMLRDALNSLIKPAIRLD